MSEITEPAAPVLDQIDALIAGQYNEGELKGEEEGAEATPTDDTPETIEADGDGHTSSEPASEQIPEEGEAVELEGDLDTTDDGDNDSPDIDYDMLIPMSDGREAIKLGDMKDMVNGLEREKQDVDSQRMAVLAQETELNQYMQAVGVQVPPEFQQYMAKKQGEYLEGQHQLMLKMMPEVTDKASFDTMRSAIVDVAKASNFSMKEISEIGDARVVHLLNRLAKFEAKEKQQQETVTQLRGKKPLKSVKPKPRTRQSKLDKQVQHATESNDSRVKDAAIKALLG